MIGTVKFYDDKKGYGFIIQTDGKPNIFFHASGLIGDKPTKDDEVQYDEDDGKKGPIAINVNKL